MHYQPAIAIAIVAVAWGVATKLFNDATCTSLEYSSLAFKEVSWLLAGCFW